MLLRVLIFLAALLPARGELSLPPRPADAPGGTEFARRIELLDFRAREAAIVAEVVRGNVPDFWRKFVPVEFTHLADHRETKVKMHVAPDYLAVGSDADYFLVPISPPAVQPLLEKLDCVLPTRKMVDEIHRAAPVKLEPIRIPPSDAMTTVPVFARHNESVREQRAKLLVSHPLGTLVAGDKKDVVTSRLVSEPGNRKVAIYGWHQPDGKPIQPLYAGHTWSWVDYSHGARFVSSRVEINGTPKTVAAVLADPALVAVLSDEGTLEKPPIPKPEILQLEPGVRVWIDQPASTEPRRATRLVLYALPNGNTIEQTIGRRVKPGDDWHFDIQHIGAQTTWLRARLTDARLVVAYLECAEKSWPAWRKKHDPDGKRIEAIVDQLSSRFGPDPRIVLTGHSGGGSFIFGYLNAVNPIPKAVERIAFLDSNYAYDAKLGHDAKLAQWLAAEPWHHLCVLAYHDSVALLNGKTFVSEKGGTWGRSLAMHEDLTKHFPFTEEKEGDWRWLTALEGRVKFILRENPKKEILHTRQVELNGFIHSMLTGTPLENKDYTYFGARAYGDFIAQE